MLNQALIIGRAHRLTHQNCHDTVLTGSPRPGTAYGLVLDGCGSKFREGAVFSRSHNEVGAKLLGHFAATFLHNKLTATGPGPHTPVPSLPSLLDSLYQASLSYLTQLLASLPFTSPVQQAQFIATHLLSTLVGFVLTPSSALFFWSGDGYLCKDGDILPLESGNQPDYLAYQLLADQMAPATERAGFQAMEIERPHETKWLAVATDGWDPALLAKLKTSRPGPRLQRWVNVRARERGYFNDDGAVAVWRQLKDQPTKPGDLDHQSLEQP